ncbi:MAG: UTP--glucose-1-phosphate uridylyltransferase [Patescibacteria group bacterium]|jgi:UTP--glucose-1-phosphate uridylyltransferase|nr:UTP--glucose-1-phosphate uridylyltransferase [Patescibacteria group bacterium]
MNKKITKAVIPVAGFGTRFFPATKAQPKQMLPILDKPVIQYIVEEMVESGIKQIILVTGADKRAIEDHFDYNDALALHLEKQGKKDVLEQMEKISNMADFIYVRQKGPYGNGTPLLNVQEIIGDEPFICAFGDDVFMGEKPAVQQIIEVYNQYGGSVIGSFRVDQNKVNQYGVLDVEKKEDKIYQIKDIVEKPLVKDAPSNLVVTGRYLFTPDIFKALKEIQLDGGKELCVSDAIDILLGQNKPFYAREIDGTYYDCGNKFEFLKAIVDVGLQRPEFKKDLIDYLKAKI